MNEKVSSSNNVLRGGLLMALSTVIFASYGLLVRFIKTDAILLVWAMQVVGAICFFLYLLKKKALMFPRKIFLTLVLMTVLVALADFIYFNALRMTTVSTAVFLKFLYPIIIIALTFKGSGIPLKKLLAMVVLALGGLILVLFSRGFSFSADKGALLALAVAFLLALYVILLKKVLSQISIQIILLYRYAVATILFLPFIFSLKSAAGQINSNWLGLIGFGFLFAVLATVIQGKGIEKTKVQYAVIIGYLELFAASILSIIFLGEKMTFPLAAGGLLILLACTLSLKKE
jgi:drug/metabolite transporter (DMT)-like permease